jgi:hypothetical protein
MEVINVSCHDAHHLVVDLVFFFFASNGATFQGKHVDDPVLAEELLVVEGVVALLVEVVLVRVIELDGDFAIGGLLAKEGAGMGEHFFVDSPGAGDNDLTELVGREHFIGDELLQRGIGVVAFKLFDSLNRVNHAVLDKKVSKRSI